MEEIKKRKLNVRVGVTTSFGPIDCVQLRQRKLNLQITKISTINHKVEKRRRERRGGKVVKERGKVPVWTKRRSCLSVHPRGEVQTC